MEFEGFKRCLDFIWNGGMSVSTLISDQHISIGTYMREEKRTLPIPCLKKENRKHKLISNTAILLSVK